MLVDVGREVREDVHSERVWALGSSLNGPGPDHIEDKQSLFLEFK